MAGRRGWTGALARGACVGAVLAALVPGAAEAASSKGCVGGGFALTLGDGTTLRGEQRGTIAAARLGNEILVRGRHVTFEIRTADFAVFNHTFTGAANPLNMTDGSPIVAFASKIPDHRGLVLTDGASFRLKRESLEIMRTGAGLSMKIQAKDCAQGGVFQMEPEREDETTTRITHTLGPDAFYFDNPNFRAREGDVVPYKDTTVTVPARTNFATDRSPRFVGRDSPQVATRVEQGCVNTVPAPRRPGGTATVDHCGGVSVWDVASGGRMGGVFGEDSTEVAPPATECTEDCQAQNQVRGQAVVLGFPFPVPVESRLLPRFPA